eukprot:183472-Rhodomonas_salina.2
MSSSSSEHDGSLLQPFTETIRSSSGASSVTTAELSLYLRLPIFHYSTLRRARQRACQNPAVTPQTIKSQPTWGTRR